MVDDMPKPQVWVAISNTGASHFVHVRDGASRMTLGPFATHHEAVLHASKEAARLDLASQRWAA